MNPEATVVKNLIREIVGADNKSQLIRSLSLRGLSWDRLHFLLIYNELGPFLYVLLKDAQTGMPDEMFNFLKNRCYSALYRFLLYQQEMLTITRQAQASNVGIIPIKGMSFPSSYYVRFGFRPVSDIDILAKEDDLQKSIRLLEYLGYRKHLRGATEAYWRKEQCHLCFEKDRDGRRVICELHWALDCKRGVGPVLPNMWAHLKTIPIGDRTIPVLSPEDTVCSLALHNRRFGKVCNLKYVCDMGMILTKEKLDWDYLLRTAFDEKIRASLYFLLYQTSEVLDINCKVYLAALKITSWQKKMINLFVRKYLYSPPSPSRLYYAYMLSHLLLYDRISYPILYILNIPQEQFAKFYGLPLYARRTTILYRIRLPYILYRCARMILGKRS